jgi:hypothetical protein
MDFHRETEGAAESRCRCHVSGKPRLSSRGSIDRSCRLNTSLRLLDRDPRNG